MSDYEIDQIISGMADEAQRRGIPNDAEPGGELARFVVETSNAKPEQLFYVVFLLSIELGKRSRLNP